MSELRLRPVQVRDECAILDAHGQLSDENFPFALELVEGQPFPDYVQRLNAIRCGLDLAPDRVPAAFLLADIGGVLVGRSSIRFDLTPWLLRMAATSAVRYSPNVAATATRNRSCGRA